MGNPTKAISIRAPWWWFILHGGKDIENRDWPTNFRGTVYMHASKWWRTAEIMNDWNFYDSLHGFPKRTLQRDQEIGTQVSSSRGCIVGTVDIVDCVSKSSSPWFFGDYGFVLANPVALARPVPCKGALGFFTVPDEVLREIPAP